MINVPQRNRVGPNPSTGDLCPICKGARWVCEAHPDRPWGIQGECDCGEPGMPCKFCNPCGGPDDPPDCPAGLQANMPLTYRDRVNPMPLS